MVGPGGFEPPTPALSERCSNQMSYEPMPQKQQRGTVLGGIHAKVKSFAVITNQMVSY